MSPSNEQDFDTHANAQNRTLTHKEEQLEPYSFGKVDFKVVTLESSNDLESSLAPLGYSMQDAIDFAKQYNENCVELFKAIKDLRFNDLGEIWASFWQSSMKESGDR